ncbi:dsRBD fold-containing protein [Actinoplanes sp. NPDC024001]|uniref:dsRBD fold-containing protein n=1 Tax=Actinoplanes sp. NPDC024001 TaxID=3154598 RepID=UPI0033F0B630
MTRTRTWTVEITIDEHEDERRTRAVAVLRTEARPQVRGEGVARRSPRDREVPEIGDELAAARALADLAYQLLDVTAGDIEAVVHRPVHLTS